MCGLVSCRRSRFRTSVCEFWGPRFSITSWLRRIPSKMLRRFRTLRARGYFPLEVARGTLSCRPERVPNMTAFADPADIDGRLELTLRALDNTTVGISHRGGVRVRSSGAARGDDLGICPWLARMAPALHAESLRRRQARKRGSKFDGCKEAKIVVRNLLQQSG